MTDWSKIPIEAADVEAMTNLIEEKGRPVHINVLARAVVERYLRARSERLYAPGASYVAGETIRLDGQKVAVQAVRAGGQALHRRVGSRLGWGSLYGGFGFRIRNEYRRT